MTLKLLFISPTSLFPQDRGQRVRIANMVRACSKSFSVTLIQPEITNEQQRLETRSLCSRLIEVSASAMPIGSLRKLFMSMKSLERLDNARCSLIAQFNDAIKPLNIDEFDLIWVERRDLLQCVGSNISKTVVDLDDIEHRKKLAELLLRKSTMAKIRGVPRIIGLLFGEVIITRHAKAVVVCSLKDEAYLRQLGLKRAQMVPNGTSMRRMLHSEVQNRRDVQLVFLGNMEYTANSDALVWFSDQIAPELARCGLVTQLTVIGNPPANATDFPPSIVFKGFVEDLPTELSRYDVAVAPLRFGGGTKLKVLDVLAIGLPLVTTSVGAEGIDLRHGFDALIADEAQDFASAIITLAHDASLRHNLSASAVERIRSNYSWESIVEQTGGWLRSLIT